MSYDSIDYQRIRARTEQRIMPLLRLYRRRIWLFGHIVAFLLLNWFMYSSPWNATFFSTEETSYVNFDGTSGTFTRHFPYSALLLISVIWLIALVYYALNLWADFRREGFIQREMNKEAELERLRLSIVLARFGESVDDPLSQTLQRKSEKPKRTVSLSDDGELIANDELPDTPLRRNTNHREG